MKYLSLFFLILILLNSCEKKQCNREGGYEFVIPASLSPAKDTFNIGDTITFISSFSNVVYERTTNKLYKLENFRFYPELRIREISGASSNEAALSDFKVLVDSIFDFSIFNYSSGSIGYVGDYNYMNNEYNLKYQLIPQDTGFFFFAHILLINQLGKRQQFEGKCRNISIDALVKLNNGADNNVGMLEDSPDPHFNDWILKKPAERFHKFGGYCFYVKK